MFGNLSKFRKIQTSIYFSPVYKTQMGKCSNFNGGKEIIRASLKLQNLTVFISFDGKELKKTRNLSASSDRQRGRIQV